MSGYSLLFQTQRIKQAILSQCPNQSSRGVSRNIRTMSIEHLDDNSEVITAGFVIGIDKGMKYR